MRINFKMLTIIVELFLLSFCFGNTISGHSGLIKLMSPETNGSGYFSISISSLSGPGAVGDSSLVESSEIKDYLQSTNHASFLVSLGDYVDIGGKVSFIYDSIDKYKSNTKRRYLFKMNNAEIGLRTSFKRTGIFRAGMYLYGNIPTIKKESDIEYFYYPETAQDSLDGNIYHYDHRKFSDEFLYNPKASFGGKLLMSLGNDYIKIIMNGGYLYRLEDTLPNVMTLGGGMEFYTSPKTRIFLEWDGEKLLKKENNITNEEFPQRAGGGLKYITNDNFSVTIGGFGALDKGIDAPKWQVYTGITLSGNWIDPDTDNDGIIDDIDSCPNEPEDFDGFEDGDGCPELDNDKDGVTDLNDKCPNEPEDRDGYQDDDGCPEDDNDSDGIKDTYDKCPNDPEDFDGYEDVDGCPENDNDNDGILDNIDKCPAEPEDFDGWQDDDGCPEFDNDGDGISDDLDKCPNEAETFNGFEDQDGCPDAVILKKDERIILNNIYFKLGSAELETESFETLNSVKRIFLDNPGIVIQIEGHTDSQGSDEYNLNLSQQRANSVTEYITKVLGIGSNQLSSVGYGEERPIATNKTSNGRAQNRRIEFKVISTGK